MSQYCKNCKELADDNAELRRKLAQFEENCKPETEAARQKEGVAE